MRSCRMFAITTNFLLQAVLVVHTTTTFTILTATSTTVVHALTPIPYNCTERGCLNNGVCGVGAKALVPQCQCPNNYRGADCGIAVQVCGGGGRDGEGSQGDTQEGIRECYNGGVCISSSDGSSGPQDYRCDCPKARHQIPLFEGEQCEIQAYTSCTTLSAPGGDSSDPSSQQQQQQEPQANEIFSFCVHGGTCTEFVSLQAKTHTACDCSTARVQEEVLAWGEHCEVLHSLYPDEDDDVPRYAPLRVIAVFSLAVSLVTMIAYVLWRTRVDNCIEDQHAAIEAAVVVQQQQGEGTGGQQELVEEGAHPIRVEEDNNVVAASEEEVENNNMNQTPTTRKGQMGPEHTIT